MTAVRPPTVAGVGGGVGVSTLAAALCGHDGGRTAVDSADIVACRGTLDSLQRAATVLDNAAPGARPVLAVTLDGARMPRGPLRTRLLLLEPVASAVVLLPHVRRWRTVADPLPEAATLLVDPPEHLARPLRLYVTALRELAAAVAESGRLHVAVPDTPAADPAMARPHGSPRTPATARGGTAIPPRRVAPARPAGHTAPTGHVMPVGHAAPAGHAVPVGHPAAVGPAVPVGLSGRRDQRATPPVVRSFHPVDDQMGPSRRAAAGGTLPAEHATAARPTPDHAGAAQPGTGRPGTTRTAAAPRRGVRIIPATPRTAHTRTTTAAPEDAWPRSPAEQVG